MGKKRPQFPKRAVVTAGMPYGNKELHFGHVGGMFVHADTFARFLRDRIGKDNVIFVTGTDCYGSPIVASYQKAVAEGAFQGSMHDYVEKNHLRQKEVLSKYEIEPNLYGASGLERAGEIHEQVSREVFEKLYNDGYLVKMSSPQFYDTEIEMLLNGRQVEGICPIEGCKSEKAYADECSLGHQYSPKELIEPRSIMSGGKLKLVNVDNWYFKLTEYNDFLIKRNEYLAGDTNHRPYLLNTIEEFLKLPILYVKRKDYVSLEGSFNDLPEHHIIDEVQKSSVALVFRNLDDRDQAQNVLMELGLRYRSGKTLVPFRLTGNVEWGIPAPVKEGLENLTFWVWPESLWAPISFTRAYLEQIGEDPASWKEWWYADNSQVYQFIGEDNIFFYGVAEMGMFMALQGFSPLEADPTYRLPHLIANKHILFMDKKASSSSEVKPPMAGELLEHYTPEQLRMHFLSLGLAKKSVSFYPQAYLDKEHQVSHDVVLKDGNLLTNVLNRLIRSCFYTSQNYYDSKVPLGDVSTEIMTESEEAALDYERAMYDHEFHSVIYILDSYLRRMNKYWVNNMREAEAKNDDMLRTQILIDGFHAIRMSLLLLHPIAPTSCDLVRGYLNASEEIWNWELMDKSIFSFIEVGRNLKFLAPKVDFFEKHPSQFI